MEAQPGAVEGLYACVADLHPFDEGSGSTLEIKRIRMPIEVKSRIRISTANLQMSLTVRKRKKYNLVINAKRFLFSVCYLSSELNSHRNVRTSYSAQNIEERHIKRYIEGYKERYIEKNAQKDRLINLILRR